MRTRDYLISCALCFSGGVAAAFLFQHFFAPDALGLTSMNFFNEQPDMSYLDSNHSREVLLKDFATIHDQPTYGDLVCLIADKGDLVHMCVYIADDFVFTKNGINY